MSRPLAMSVMRVFLVGGAVRDKLLGLPVKEQDWVVVGASPEEMIEQGFRPVGKNFPVFLHPQTKEEYALARRERKTGRGYHGFTFHTGSDVSLEEDLSRRDLTINAMVRDENDQLIDPFDGKRDLEQKILRHISPAFAEDPVRVLRVARFLARFSPLGFRVAGETIALMKTMKACGEIDALVAERVWRELLASLSEPAPAMFFILLKQVGALEVIAPELEPVFDGSPRAENFAQQLVQASAVLEPVEVFAVLAAWCADQEIMLDGLCERLKAPVVYLRMARAVPLFHALIQSNDLLNPETLLTYFEKLSLFRSPAMLNRLLQVWQFCEMPTVLDEHAKKLILHTLKVALKSLLAIDMEPVVASCGDKREIKQAVRTARLECLSDLLSTLPE